MKKCVDLSIDLPQYIGAKHAVMVPSARYGFYLLLRAMGVEEDDEVVIPALTYFAIPAMVPLLKAKVVLADVGLHSHVLDQMRFKPPLQTRPRSLFQRTCLVHLVIWDASMRLPQNMECA